MILQIGAALTGLGAVVAFGGTFVLGSRAAALHDQVARLNVRTSPSVTGFNGGQQASRSDFVRRLPRTPKVASLLEEFRRAATEAGVTILSLTTDAREPTERTLGRLQIAVVLRGSYPTVKVAMAQVAGRFPNLALQRVSVRRLATPTDVEARVDVMLPVAPEHRASDSPPSN